jgi:hypothetical protein
VGDAEPSRLGAGLTKRLAGLSGSLWLIWLGRRANGLDFSGDNAANLVGDRPDASFVGDEVGVTVRVVVAGETLF